MGTGADFIADGFVDSLDLTALPMAWPTSGLDASSVPELGTLGFLGLGGLALLRRRRRMPHTCDVPGPGE